VGQGQRRRHPAGRTRLGRPAGAHRRPRPAQQPADRDRPTATIASIAGCYECIEPQVSNLFKRETLSGEFMQINRYLVRELQARGLWDEQMINDIKRAEGSVQDVDRIPDELKEIFRTAWEIPQRALIDMAAERGAFIDQSQSLNLFMETPTSASSPRCTCTPGRRA
jgi:ribonucleotide reductase alpha subunit